MTPEEPPPAGDAADVMFREMAQGRRTAEEVVVTARPIPKRHWRSYCDDPLPTGRETLDEPMAAFPPWVMRVTCDRCGKSRMLNEVHHPSERAPC